MFQCPEHPWASRKAPCHNWHAPARIKEISPARLINRKFCSRLTPTFFNHVCCRGSNRRSNLTSLATSPLAANVETLRLDVAPRDFGPAWSNEVHGYPPRDRPWAYFDDLRVYLTPNLRHFHNVRTLHLTTTYSGLHLAGMSRGELLLPCFSTLCKIVRDARLPALECIQIGLPYEGGYAGFFKEPGHRKLLESISGNICSASVKLADWQDNFTIMPIA